MRRENWEDGNSWVNIFQDLFKESKSYIYKVLSFRLLLPDFLIHSFADSSKTDPTKIEKYRKYNKSINHGLRLAMLEKSSHVVYLDINFTEANRKMTQWVRIDQFDTQEITQS